MRRTVRIMLDLALATAAYGLYTSLRSYAGRTASRPEVLPGHEAGATAAWPESGAEAHPLANITDLPPASPG